MLIHAELEDNTTVQFVEHDNQFPWRISEVSDPGVYWLDLQHYVYLSTTRPMSGNYLWFMVFRNDPETGVLEKTGVGHSPFVVTEVKEIPI